MMMNDGRYCCVLGGHQVVIEVVLGTSALLWLNHSDDFLGAYLDRFHERFIGHLSAVIDGVKEGVEQRAVSEGGASRLRGGAKNWDIYQTKIDLGKPCMCATWRTQHLGKPFIEFVWYLVSTMQTHVHVCGLHSSI